MDKNARIRIGIATLLIAALVTTLALHFTAAQSPSVSSGYTIDGDSVYWEVENKGRITVSPHTSHGRWDAMRYQTIEFESYLGSDEEITCGMAFNKMPRDYGLSLQKDHVVQYPVWDESLTNETNGTIIGYENVTESYWQDVTPQLTTGNKDSKFFGYGTFTVPASGKKTFQVRYILNESDPIVDGKRKWEMRCWQGSFTSPTWEINLDPWADGLTCIAYYTFDNNQSNTTHALNWANCTGGDLIRIGDGVANSSVGNDGEAYDLAGTLDYLNGTKKIGVTGAADTTVGGWMYLDTVVNNGGFISFGTPPGTRTARSFQEGASNFYYHQTGGADVWGGSVSTGSWVHFVVVVNNSATNTTTYINGAKLVGGGHSALNTGDSSLQVGMNFIDGASMDGRIDDFFLFADALSEDQIQAVYVNGTKSLWSAPSGSANESAGRTAIAAGITASTASSGTTYTDRQMYIHYLNGTQKLGTFDKVLSEGSQRWLFNYNTTGESYTNMESIAPTIYVWENTSLTAAQITAQVSGFINATDT